jgi:hypothetical protein
MRWFVIIPVFSLSTAVAIAQAAVAPVPVPVSYGFSNSVIDHNGRVLILNATYSYPPVLDGQALAVRFPPIVTTHVTVIASDANSKQDSQYQGTFQVVGVGRYAVYAIVTSYPTTSTASQAPASMTRQLVALGPSFPTLPSIDIALGDDVKVSAVGDGSAPDTIAIVAKAVAPLASSPLPSNPIPRIVGPLPSIPTQPRTLQMYLSDGNSFKALPSVVLSNP